jgi:nucleotide-binding universal stress UspA family protein
MYQKSVVAADGSESSKRALDEAVRIATLTHGELHAVYLVEKAPGFPYTCHYDTATLCHPDRLSEHGSACNEPATPASVI